MKNSLSRPVFNRPTPQLLEYRFYYDQATGVGILKNTGEAVPGTPYIVVDEATYKSIDFCSKYKVVDGKLVGKVIKQIARRLRKQNGGKFKTIKNNMLFIVNNNYTGPTEDWDYFNDN